MLDDDARHGVAQRGSNHRRLSRQPRRQVPAREGIPPAVVSMTSSTCWAGMSPIPSCSLRMRKNSFGACSLFIPGAGYRLGSDRGSPNHGSTLASKRVMAQIRSLARVST